MMLVYERNLSNNLHWFGLNGAVRRIYVQFIQLLKDTFADLLLPLKDKISKANVRYTSQFGETIEMTQGSKICDCQRHSSAVLRLNSNVSGTLHFREAKFIRNLKIY